MAVAWTERWQPQPVGVDHLGMRVAGESAYARLFDFTTTVSFRPRYYSYTCAGPSVRPLRTLEARRERQGIASTCGSGGVE